MGALSQVLREHFIYIHAVATASGADRDNGVHVHLDGVACRNHHEDLLRGAGQICVPHWRNQKSKKCRLMYPFQKSVPSSMSDQPTALCCQPTCCVVAPASTLWWLSAGMGLM